MSPDKSKDSKDGSKRKWFRMKPFRDEDEFWKRTTDGLELQEIWAQFKEETREGYKVSSREIDWNSIKQEKEPKRTFAIAGAVTQALYMKLTPARRVLLLVSLVFVFMAVIGIRIGVIPDATWTILAAITLVMLLALELAERVSMKRDLEIARDIQSWLVPKEPPPIPGCDIAFITRPANTVAGDYYDAFLKEGGTTSTASSRLFLVVADVAGKSVPAAMLMATFQASLRTLAASSITLGELTESLNRYACAHSLNGRRFTTAFMAELDLEDSSLTYVAAGHNAPILRRATGSIERLEAGGIPLGVQENWPYEIGETSLSPDDLLFIFSDGVSEAVNENNAEYGEFRLEELLSLAPKEDAAASLNRVLKSLDKFVGKKRQYDDITCLVLRKE